MLHIDDFAEEDYTASSLPLVVVVTIYSHNIQEKLLG